MGVKKFKISHQRKNCIGCGSCVMYAKNRWKMNDKDGLADLIGGKEKGDYIVAEADIDEFNDNKEAEKVCPMQIIKIDKKLK
ncbi:MAG: ferredoxin [Candidatus Pacebacteria bacterium]|nr:ferredoxin [Candidatus Paceibacterota bacterium]